MFLFAKSDLYTKCVHMDLLSGHVSAHEYTGREF